jgi:hypothetical protein
VEWVALEFGIPERVIDLCRNFKKELSLSRSARAGVVSGSWSARVARLSVVGEVRKISGILRERLVEKLEHGAQIRVRNRRLLNVLEVLPQRDDEAFSRVWPGRYLAGRWRDRRSSFCKVVADRQFILENRSLKGAENRVTGLDAAVSCPLALELFRAVGSPPRLRPRRLIRWSRLPISSAAFCFERSFQPAEVSTPKTSRS